MLALYHCPEARSMRALWILEEMGLPFELHELDFSMASLRDPAFLAVSPLGRVPCLVDGDTRVFESGAIIQYLGEHYDDDANQCGRLHRAPGDRERTDWLIWLHYAETMAVHGASLVQQRVFVGKENRSPVVQKLESKRLIKSLEVVDAAVAQHPYLLPSGFSAVDIAVGYSVHLATSFVDFTHLTHVSRYYETLRARPAFQRSLGSRKGQAPSQGNRTHD
jgi:glutathione S-transferase